MVKGYNYYYNHGKGLLLLPWIGEALLATNSS